MIDDDFVLVDSGTGARRVRLGDYLDPEAEERAIAGEYAWIKRLRHLNVDAQPMRRRFTFRGDSLWWFTELYLHKEQVVLSLFRAIAALQRVIEQERPLQLDVSGSSAVVRDLARHTAAPHRVRVRGSRAFRPNAVRLLRMDLRAAGLTYAALASRARLRGGRADRPPGGIAAFVHRAFWRAGTQDGSAESYIGPVLQELERRNRDGIQYVGIGPAENFRARRWWHALQRSRHDASVIPIELLAPLRAMKESTRLWRSRHDLRRALWSSAELRQHAVISGYDCWNIVREQLAGIALLQWPWSARAMDEAAAALDALRPAVALTYAEAGGWGRALMLEARRRGIPSIGLQHGFIYRSWLNYLHEPDEIQPDAVNASDIGFPGPTVTLLFDEHARAHLEQRGRFPAASLAVTGSPRLDALVRTADALSHEDVDRAREAAGAEAARPLVLFAAKYRQARHVLGALAEAMSEMPDVQLAIKTHPAETSDAYDPIATGHPNVRVLPASAPLAPLLRASRAIVTVNSTVALDAAVLGIPALVIGLPNNLSPFVDAGIMAGAANASEIGTALRRILYDEQFRLQLERARSVYLRRFGMSATGEAAGRAADAITRLMKSGRVTADGCRTKGQ
jgi:Capsule polysaccharide biosynthesis protein